MTANVRKIALVAEAVGIFAKVQERLVAQGHEVIRFPDFSAFAASSAARETALLYALGHLPLDAATLAAAPNLRAVLSPHTGIEGFDLEAATRATVVVGNAPTAENFESMAEAALLLILACLYDLPGKTAQMASGGERLPVTSRMLKGKRVGMIGFGRIGRALAQRLDGFGAVNQAFTRHGAAAAEAANVAMVALDELLATSDIICVLATLNEESRGMLDAPRLASCKPGAILVNVARGGLVDEDALYELAAKGHFARIALDVFAIEPLPMGSPLRNLPNGILTPHAIGHTVETFQSLVDAGFESIIRVMAGDAPLYPCNPEVLPAWRARWHQGQTQ
jgi:phosphoglycerate dehydrogenase-like enzyme